MVNWAYSVDGDLGTLEVGARAEAGVVSLRAHIRAYGSAEDVAVVEDFVLVSGTVQDGVWRTPGPSQLADLGYYQVVVDVIDADGVVASGPSWGSLSYVLDTAFTPLRADPPSVTYTDREVTLSGTLTVSGQLTWLSPDSGWQPLAGKQVGVMFCGGSMGHCQNHEYPITDAHGRYSVTMTPLAHRPLRPRGRGCHASGVAGRAGGERHDQD